MAQDRKTNSQRLLLADIPKGGSREHLAFELSPERRVFFLSLCLILVIKKQREADLCEFKASLVYVVSSRTARTVTQRNLSQNKTKQTNQT